MQLKLFLSVCVAVLTFILLPQVALAVEITLSPSQDTFIDQDYPTDNFGNYSTLYVSTTDINKHILLKFDLADIPKGSTINSATLLMDANGCGGQDETPELLLSYANDNWGEQSVTWNTRPRVGVQIDLIDANPRLKSFAVTKAVTSWFTKTKPNYGMILTVQGGPYSCEFHSRERSLDDITLVVDYKAPFTFMPLKDIRLDVPLITLNQDSTPAAQTASPTSNPLDTVVATASASPIETPAAASLNDQQLQSIPENDADVSLTPRQIIALLLVIIAVLVLAMVVVVMNKKETKVGNTIVIKNISEEPEESENDLNNQEEAKEGKNL